MDDATPLEVDGINLRSLFRAIEHAYRSLEWSRTQNRNLIKEFHGPAYGGGGGIDKPVNKMNQLVEAFTMLTVANKPGVQVDTPVQMLRGHATVFEKSLNNLTDEISLEDTLRRWVQDAFFMVGVIKLHRDKYRQVPYGDLTLDPGIPGASNIPLDDWCYDVTAKKWLQIGWCADKYRVPFAFLQDWVDQGIADPDVVAQLTPTTKEGAEEGRVDQISRSEITDEDELEPHVDLADVWVAKTQKIYTFAVQDCQTFRLRSLKPIAVTEWKDPDQPPHHILGFSDVPYNIMPLSPASHLDVLDRAFTSTLNKGLRQIRAQKSNPMYKPAGGETASALKKAIDNEGILGDPTTFQVVETGGLHPKTQAAIMTLGLLWQDATDGIPNLLANAAHTGTVGQEQIAQAAGNRKVGSLQSRVSRATSKLLRSLGFMLWDDKFHSFTNTLTVGDMSSTEGMEWRPYEREGNFLQYNFSINDRSMEHNPPAQQAQTLMGALQNLYLPMQQMMMAQGQYIDMETLTKELAKMLDVSALESIVKTSAPTEDQEAPTSSLKSPSTVRKYQHESTPRQEGPMAQMQEAYSMLTQSQPQGAPA